MKKRPPRGAAAVIPEGPAGGAPAGPVIERPDGYYWLTADGRQEFGPFDTLEGARADRDRDDDNATSAGEVLHEAEFDIGIADWIDPETGAPAEGQSPPHLEID